MNKLKLFIKKRARNVGFWVTISPAILLLVQAFGVEITTEVYQDKVNLLLTILTAIGVLNNPTTEGHGLGDDDDQFY